MKDYRIEITVRNNRIVEHMRQVGYVSVSSFCKASGLCYTVVLDYINLKRKPIYPLGLWKETATNLAKALCCEPSDLWTDLQRTMALKKNKKAVAIAEKELSGLINFKNPLQIIEEKETTGKIDEALNKFGFREKDILRMRFGMKPYFREYTLKEVGEKYNVDKERIRQIEAQTLRKLRHPTVDLGQ